MQAFNCEPPRIIDAFLANDEIDLAKFRIAYLDSYVDLVVIGESNVTFRGTSKPLYFKDWLAKFPHLSKKVVTVSLNLSGDDAWQRESSAREALLDFLISNYPNAGYIISDLDEIPSKSQVTEMRKIHGDYHFRTPTFYRKANWSTLDWNKNWNKAVFTTRSQRGWPNAGRHMKLPQIESNDEGCHFSYLGFDSKQMQNKLKSFSHIELDFAEIANQFFLEYCDMFLIDHLGRVESDSFGLLRQLSYDELPTVAKELHTFRPELFDFKRSKKSILHRLQASALVSTVTKSSHLSQDAFLTITGIQISFFRKLHLDFYCFRLIAQSILKRQIRKLRRALRVLR
jgi:beta-1,4-mannosyl-glycoprotein beta-1,4-N-acetylglucosaminyltransferase